jgi:hypothetical protein
MISGAALDDEMNVRLMPGATSTTVNECGSRIQRERREGRRRGFALGRFPPFVRRRS